MRTRARRAAALFAAAALSVVGLAAGPATATPSTADDSTTYQVTADHQGWQDAGGVARPSRLLWSQTFDGHLSYPVIAAGRIFVSVGQDHNGSKVVCSAKGLSRATGAVLWGSKVSRGSCAITYDRHRVFALGSIGRLLAFRAADGTEVWRSDLNSSQEGFAYGVPVAANGSLFAAGVDNAPDGGVYRIDEATGRILWRNDSWGYVPTVTAGRVFTTYRSPSAVAVDRATHHRTWFHQAAEESSLPSVSAAHGTRLWVPDIDRDSDRGLVLDQATGHLVRHFRSTTTPAFAGDTVLVVDRGVLRARDLHTGRIRWSFSGDGHLVTAPLVTGGTVYVGSMQGRVFGVSLRSGRVIWKHGFRRDVDVPSFLDMPITGIATGENLLVISAYFDGRRGFAVGHLFALR